MKSFKMILHRFLVYLKADNKTIVLLFLILLAPAIFFRLVLLDRQGLWNDELFSLAMSGGHSTEHLPYQASELFGDFIDKKEVVQASYYKKFTFSLKNGSLEHVIRAIQQSDTSPPLYYILLNLWRSVFGSTDMALRFLSFLFWLFSLIPFCLLAQKTGAPKVSYIALFFYYFSPLCVYYSTEGRHYSLLFFLICLIILLTIKIREQNFSFVLFFMWFMLNLGCFLVHYFYLFVFCAVFLWSLFYLDKKKRGWLLILTLLLFTLLLYLWYYKFPMLTSQWRVTGGWLQLEKPKEFNPLYEISKKITQFFTLSAGILGCTTKMGFFANTVFTLTIILLLIKRDVKGLFSDNLQLLWLWLICSCSGLLIYDLTTGAFATSVTRYALLALPAAYIIFSFWLSNRSDNFIISVLSLFFIAWVPGYATIYKSTGRVGKPYKQAALIVDEHHTDRTLVLINSNPSGILGIARYLKNEQTDLYTYVQKLGRKQVPEDFTFIKSKYDNLIYIRNFSNSQKNELDEWVFKNFIPLKEKNGKLLPKLTSPNFELFFLRIGERSSRVQ